jgi:hypothetical protein
VVCDGWLSNRFDCSTIFDTWQSELRNDCGCKDRAEEEAVAALTDDDIIAITNGNVLNGGAAAEQYLALRNARQNQQQQQPAGEATPVNGGNGVVRSTVINKINDNDNNNNDVGKHDDIKSRGTRL